MAINLPSAPSLGDTFTVGSAVYQWDGQSWQSVVTASGVPVNVPNFITLGGTNNISVAAGTNLRFRDVIFSSGTLAAPSAFNVTTGAVALEANKTYELMISAYFSGWSSGGGGYFFWVDADTNVPLITAPDRAGAALAASSVLTNRISSLVFRPSTAINVIARTGGYFVGGVPYPEWAGTAIFRTNASICTIKEMR